MKKPQQVPCAGLQEVDFLIEALRYHRVRGGFTGPFKEARADWWDKLQQAKKAQSTNALCKVCSGPLAAYVRYKCEL